MTISVSLAHSWSEDAGLLEEVLASWKSADPLALKSRKSVES